MADNENMEEEDLFADLYDNDDTAPSRDQIPTQSAPEPIKSEQGPGYGEEPDTGHDPNSFELDSAMQDQPANGSAGHPNEPTSDSRDHEPRVQLKDDGKMFIGGLNWETTDQSLHDYFSQFGEVQECTVMRDGATGRSRGFGFLTFKDPKAVNIVVVKEHYLDGKIIDPKRAIPKDEQEKTAKIFVGGVSQEATEAGFKAFFEQFGLVIDATLMMDKDTGRPRGFGFVTFDSDTAVQKVLEHQPLEILNKPIEVKRAQPRGKIGEEDDFRGRGRGGGKFGRDDRFGGDNNMNQNQGPSTQGMNGMSPQMMAQYWQRMQQYFSMMQQQMMQNAMGGMGQMQMNPQMMAQMQQMQQMQMKNMQGGGNSPGQNMNPQQMQQMMQMMGGMQGGMNGGMGGGMGGNMGGGGGTGAGRGRGFVATEQNAFEQQKYEQQARRHGSTGPKGFQQGGAPQSWEGMYDDVPQPEGANQGGRGSAGPMRNSTPTNSKAPQGAPTGPSNAPANAPTGPKNAGQPGSNWRGGGGRGRGGGRGGRFHPYGR